MARALSCGVTCGARFYLTYPVMFAQPNDAGINSSSKGSFSDEVSAYNQQHRDLDDVKGDHETVKVFVESYKKWCQKMRTLLQVHNLLRVTHLTVV